jgi:hypothetical protein
MPCVVNCCFRPSGFKDRPAIAAVISRPPTNPAGDAGGHSPTGPVALTRALNLLDFAFATMLKAKSAQGLVLLRLVDSQESPTPSSKVVARVRNDLAGRQFLCLGARSNVEVLFCLGVGRLFP